MDSLLLAACIGWESTMICVMRVHDRMTIKFEFSKLDQISQQECAAIIFLADFRDKIPSCTRSGLANMALIMLLVSCGASHSQRCKHWEGHEGQTPTKQLFWGCLLETTSW